MSIDFKFRADASGVTDALKEVNESMQELSAADFAMGLEAVLGLFGKLKGAVGELGQMFSACTQAAELEAVGARLGVMLNDAASGDALAASLQRMATNGVVPLQELEQAAAARVELEAKRKQTLEVLRATESLAVFNEALKRVSDDVREGSLYFA